LKRLIASHIGSGESLELIINLGVTSFRGYTSESGVDNTIVDIIGEVTTVVKEESNMSRADGDEIEVAEGKEDEEGGETKVEGTNDTKTSLEPVSNAKRHNTILETLVIEVVVLISHVIHLVHTSHHSETLNTLRGLLENTGAKDGIESNNLSSQIEIGVLIHDTTNDEEWQ
jgi:hypothetical protein